MYSNTIILLVNRKKLLSNTKNLLSNRIFLRFFHIIPTLSQIIPNKSQLNELTKFFEMCAHVQVSKMHMRAHVHSVK